MAETDNQEVKSKRDLLRERMLKRNPDLNVEDPEAYSGGISDYLDELDGQIGDYRDHEEKLMEMFNRDPRSATFLSMWRNGDDPAVALMRMYGEEIRNKLDDPEYQEQLAAANKEYVERVAKEKDLEQQYQQNLDGTLETLSAFQQDNGLSDDQVDEVMELLQGIFQDAIVGKFSRESMEMGLKAIRHDEDVADAADAAEVKGRNTKINETLRKRENGDGVSSLSGANGKASQPQRTMSVFDYADAAK